MNEDFEIIFEPDPDFELRLLTNDPEPGILADVEEVVLEDPLVVVVAHQHEEDPTTYSVYVEGTRVASFVPSELALDIVEQIRKEYGEEDR